MLQGYPPAQTKRRQIYRQRAKQIAIHAPIPYGSIPSRRGISAPSTTRPARKKAPSSTFAPYPYFDNDRSKHTSSSSSSVLSTLLDCLLSAFPASSTSATSADNNIGASSVVGFMPRSPSVAAPPLDVSLPITIASSMDTAGDDSCSCLSSSLSSSCGSLSSSSVTSSTTCSSCSSIMAASLFLASEDSLSDILCDRYRQPKGTKTGDMGDSVTDGKAGPLPRNVSSAADGRKIIATAPMLSPTLPAKPIYRARDLRVNGAHLRMIVAEANMMRADKIVGPLRPRGSLPKRSDEFLPSRRSPLRYPPYA
ncbi:hypothetical protein BX666DRAFT_1939829 [Dichotomocladium elegans]|nr:hypothetical protein BX666DRAFT_1939829 [Dichotomocladium elegans]